MSSANGHAKRSEKGLLTPDNCVVALIDHQPQMLFGVCISRSPIDHQQHRRPREGCPGVRCARRPHDGRDEELQRKSLAADPGGVSEADADRAVVHERVGRQELRGRDQGDRPEEDRAGGALDRDVHRPSDRAGDPRRLRDLHGRRGLLRRRQPARARQRDEAHDPGRREPVTSLRCMLEWQRDWARKETYDAVMDIVRSTPAPTASASTTPTPWCTRRRSVSRSPRGRCRR